MENEVETVLRMMVPCLSKREDLLSGKNTLVLHTPLLYRLNHFLDEFQCEHPDIILTEEQRKVLESFQALLAQIPKLSLTQRSVEAFDETIDLNRFKRLTSLELKNVPVSKLKGSQLKSQLQVLISKNCADEECFSKKGKLQWASLNKFHFKFRYYQGLSLSFLNSMPWLQELDLSHNNLKECDALANLCRLTYLNISFNRLTKIPKLHNSTKTKLKVFLIDHNFLSDLTGLENMTSLTDLDLSWNWICNKFKLYSLLSLVSLQRISMKNNPFSHNDFYRIYIASSICSKYPEFSIDDMKLSGNEKSVFGSALIKKKDLLDQSCEIDALLDPELIEKPVKIIKAKKRIKPRETLISSQCYHEAPNQEKSNNSELKDVVSKQTLEIVPDKDGLLQNLKEEVNDKLLEDTINNITEHKNIEISESRAVCEPKTCNSSPEEREIFTQATTKVILHTSSVECTDLQTQRVEPQTDRISILEDEKKNCDHLEETEPILDEVQVNSMSANSQFALDIGTEQNLSFKNVEKESSEEIDMSHENVHVESHADIEHDSQSEHIENDFSQSIDKRSQQLYNDEANNKQQSLDIWTSKVVESQNNSSQDTIEQDSVTPSEVMTEENSDDDRNDQDELLWQVQIFDKVTATSEMIFLILLEKELKERCTKSGRIITRWNLDSIRSCVKTEMDPIKIELVFDSENKNKQHRCYIMEFSDAQNLMKRLYDILESKALTDLDQRTYNCLKCTNVFVQMKKSKEIQCIACRSYEVSEIDEPHLQDKKIPSKQMISHSPSESSIGSAVSLEQPRSSSFSKRYESDVEILSNPSQSSIEVIDDQSRSQSTTPSRRKSSEERQTVAVPQLSTVLEVTLPMLALTESSSSGSLTESVITAYDNCHNKKHHMTESLLEENENSLDNESTTHTTKDVQSRKSELEDGYSYIDFQTIDQRVERYLRNSLFTEEKEELRLFVRCHIWKTGGSDYEGCFVLSTSYVYFLYHCKTDFSDSECNWLTKNDSYRCEQIKYINPLFRNEGIEIKINSIVYLLLLMDVNITNKLLTSIKNLNLPKLKVGKKWKLQLDETLKEAVVNCELSSSCFDPTVTYFTIFKRIQIIKNKVDEEIMRLGSLVITHGQFYLIPGDLSWLCTCKNPAIHSCQELCRLIEVKRGNLDSLSFHFLDEQEGIEEVWIFTLNEVQILAIVSCINGPWKKLFSTPLEITYPRSERSFI